MVKKKIPAKSKRRKAKLPPRSKAKKQNTAKRRKKLKESLKKFTPRQLLYRQHRLSGKSIFVSAVLAGYSRSYAKTSASTKLDRLVKASILDELEVAGATNEKQAAELVRVAFSSVKTEKCDVMRQTEDGFEVDSIGTKVPDDMARLKGLEQIGKLKKQISAPFEKMLGETEFTRLVVVVERDAPGTEKKDKPSAGRKNIPNSKTVSRVALTD